MARTGDFSQPALPVATSGVRQEFKAPDGNDWVLLLTQR
jgi:hypothetical protein